MGKRSFTRWLRGEVAAAKCTLLILYEQIDKLKYIEGPQLEREYMDKIGSYEQMIIKEEIECELLKKKQQMMQAALNRRELIDEEAIEREIESLRQEMLREACGTEPREFAEISAEDRDELQALYGEIVRNFHPQTHSDLTTVQKELFEKALESYRLRDLAALRLIHDMLMSTLGEIPMELLAAMLQFDASESGGDAETESTDYTLAAKIYSSFTGTSDEAALKEEIIVYKQKAADVMEEIGTLKSQFPYNTVEFLQDPEQIEAYRKDLDFRLQRAGEEKESRKAEIRKMMEGATANG